MSDHVNVEEDDEYETQEQASARILNAAGAVVLTLVEPEHEEIVEYAAFNDAAYFEPLFASGTLGSALRHTLDDPLHVSNNLRSAVRFADMRNDERAHNDTLGVYGPVVVKTRTIVRSPWSEVTYDEIDRVRSR